jgi:hypothetical protein
MNKPKVNKSEEYRNMRTPASGRLYSDSSIPSPFPCTVIEGPKQKDEMSEKSGQFSYRYKFNTIAKEEDKDQSVEEKKGPYAQTRKKKAVGKDKAESAPPVSR